MKKYEYKIESYHFKITNNLALDMEKAFNKEGSNGWELVQCEVIQERLNESSLFLNTMSTTDIVATWKREVNN